ncbi:MAG: SusC/RagA family TonB-linked outer membrane protein, partial [Bacteroidales bacterium]|nr:SusC/RagA family TonB-linked outer membrane protein [Bacteroidales bacterium]
NNVAQTMYAGNGYTSGAIYDYYREIRYFRDGHVLNGYLSWDQEFGRHHIGVTAGANYDHYRSSQITLMQSGSLSNSLAYINMANGEITAATEVNSAYQTLGFFGRVNYDFAGKYLLEVSGRYDGSSRFPASSRWGFFPSVSAGWRMSEEAFWEPIKGWWNRSKLRLSYGTLGNQQVSNYYYIDTISTKQMSSYTFNGTDKTSYAQISDPVSDGLTWETVVTYNLGLDLGFLRDRLSVGVDLYIRDTKNMLTKSITLPSVYGATSPKENAADLRTKGYEITIGWRDNLKVAGRPMTYGITGSLGDYKTTITRYNNPTKLLTDYYEGMTLGEIWGYKIGGLFASDEEAAEYAKWTDDRAVNAGVYNCVAPYNKLMAGDPKFLDLDGSNTIDSGSNTVDDPGDRRIIGNSLPRFLYSLRGDFSYFGFDVNVFFQGVGKCDWMPNEACDYFWVTYRNQRPTFIPNDFEEKCWSEANPNAYFPRRRSQIAHTSFNKANDRYLQNCAYLRLKNVTIGYTLPIKNTKAIEKCRFYFSGENLAYWSPMKKYCSSIDPEVATTGAVNDCMYPYAKTFTFGVDLTF